MSDSLTKIIPAKRLEELRAESREIEVDVVFEEEEADDTMEEGVPPVAPVAAASSPRASSPAFTGALSDHEDDETAPPSPLRLPTLVPQEPAAARAPGTVRPTPVAEKSEPPPLSGNSAPPGGKSKGAGASFPPSVPRPAVAPRPPAVPRPSTSPPSVPKKA